MTKELYNEMCREAETDPELARLLEEYGFEVAEEEPQVWELYDLIEDALDIIGSYGEVLDFDFRYDAKDQSVYIHTMGVDEDEDWAEYEDEYTYNLPAGSVVLDQGRKITTWVTVN